MKAVVHLGLGLTALLASGCSESSNLGGDSLDDSGTDSLQPDPWIGTPAFTVPEFPYGLSLDAEGLVYASAQFGGKIYRWDPATDDRDEITDDVSGVLGLAWEDDTLYLTTSDSGVVGTLSYLDGRFAEDLATQSDDGTLFRKPDDLALGYDGSWALADSKAGLLFRVTSSGSTSVMLAGTDTPQAVAFDGETLYAGGDDGIWTLAWPSGVPTQVDSREALGLHLVSGEMWATNAEEGVFVVGGEVIGGSEIERPSSMAGTNPVYVADRMTSQIWALTPRDEQP